MSYRIRYGTTNKSFGRGNNILFLSLFFFWALLAIFVCVKRGSVLPGDSAVTAAAIENMVQAVSDGQSVGQAFYTFCLEVMDGAALAY